MNGTGTLKHLRNYFFTGLLVVLPVFLSITIFVWLFQFALGLTSWMIVFLPVKSFQEASNAYHIRNIQRVDEEMGKGGNEERLKALGNLKNTEEQALLRTQLHLENKPKLGVDEFTLQLVAFLLTLGFIVVVGIATKNVIGKRLLEGSESLAMRVPFFNKVYGMVKNITETFWTNQKTMFKKVALIEYPKEGIYSVGFITSESKGEVQDRTKENVVNVFIPTVPNPTSGMLVMVPREKVTVLDMSVTDGFKLIISGGAVVPPSAPAADDVKGSLP